MDVTAMSIENNLGIPLPRQTLPGVEEQVAQ